MFRTERFIENESVILNEVKRYEEFLFSLLLRFFVSLRMENVQEILKHLVLEPERVEIHTLSIDEYDRL